MDLINGALERNLKMIKNKYLNENGEPLGLMEMIRLEQLTVKPKINLVEESNKAWRRPTTNIIITSEKGARLFKEALKQLNDGKGIT
jgi:hypothetical protein